MIIFTERLTFWQVHQQLLALMNQMTYYTHREFEVFGGFLTEFVTVLFWFNVEGLLRGIN